MAEMPKADVEISPELVSRLLSEQHPDLASQSIRELTHGWDNVLYRLGDRYTIRLPRRAVAAELLRNETTWLPVLGPALPIPVPTPVWVGSATDYYPYPWSILPWFDGDVAAGVTLKTGQAQRLGEFLAALHQPVQTDHPPINPFRGIPLGERDAMTHERVKRLGRGDAARIAEVWGAAVDARPWGGPPVWLHGDLHALNLLQADGVLTAVIDFGDICTGDPATDLMVAWYLFDASERAAFREAADSAIRPLSDHMWTRARGWAVSHALAILDNAADTPVLASMAEYCLSRALTD